METEKIHSHICEKLIVCRHLNKNINEQQDRSHLITTWAVPPDFIWMKYSAPPVF